jgi:hypothetical protein
VSENCLPKATSFEVLPVGRMCLPGIAPQFHAFVAAKQLPATAE